MRVVEFECGCVGLRDSATDDTILLRECERGDVWVFYRADEDSHKGRPFTVASAGNEMGWIWRITKLVGDGHGLRTLRTIIERK